MNVVASPFPSSISVAVFLDPYELSIRSPGLNFSVEKRAPPRLSLLDRLIAWVYKSDKPIKASNDNRVDVEAPEWLADPMTVKLKPIAGANDSATDGSVVLDVPLHLRYL